MTPRTPGPAGHSVFRWWTPNDGDEIRLRRRELQDRIWWSVMVRWGFVVLGAVGTALAALDLLPVDVSAPLLGGATVGLAVTNLVYSLIGGRVRDGSIPRLTPRRFLLVEVSTDFAVLSVLTYALGTIETPTVALYLANIVLLTLHCTWKQSFVMTLVAAVFASAPVVLTGTGVLPVQSVLDSDLPQRLADNATLMTGYVLGVFIIFVTCWYVVAQLAAGLQTRERRLQEDYDRVVKVGEQKSRATLRATHELKAPLAAIKSYVYTMRDGYTGELAPGTRKVILRIGERCDLLAHRISQIIHLANLKSLEQSQLNFERIELPAVFAEEVEEAAIQGRARGVEIAWSARSVPSAPIMASVPELRAMLSNLLVNAVDYSREGGQVTVEVTADAGGVHCAVVDHGIGIPPENVGRIFEDHFRSDNAVRHRPNGSGLGMAIVAEVVRLHEAQISVTSKLEEGTTMIVTFPHPDAFRRGEWRDAATPKERQ
ncbi:MAG: HAMP domain-containing histidine kinase [Deltaproteobacteria bacterium]|nr:MAG: HAMP domain-containing histidine kinase [Deltaproteobacteria bacterium]